MPSPAWLPAPMARIIITRQHGSNNFSNIGIASHHFGKACDQRTPADPPDKSQVMSNLASKVQLHRRFCAMPISASWGADHQIPSIRTILSGVGLDLDWISIVWIAPGGRRLVRIRGE